MLLAGAMLAGCAGPNATPAAGQRPIVVQGAMDVEIRKLAGVIEHSKEEHIGGWTFWSGTLDGYPVVFPRRSGHENRPRPRRSPPSAPRWRSSIRARRRTAHDLHVYDIVLGY